MSVEYCTNCGAPVSAEWKFCKRCGAPTGSRVVREPVVNPPRSVPEPGLKTNTTRNSEMSAGALFSVLLILILIVGAITFFSVRDNNVKATPAPPPTASPAPVSITNGKKLITPSYKAICPLSVSVPAGEYDYYIYLRYLYPCSSDVTRELREGKSPNNAINDLAFYVKAGMTVEIDVPVGTYKLSYACGKTWYGQKLYFGDSTLFYTSSDNLQFYVKGDYVYGSTLELWLQNNGNFDRSPISADNFPA